MKQILFILYLLTWGSEIFANPTVFSESKQLSINEMNEDIDELISLLEENHPNLYNLSSKEIINQQVEVMKNKVKGNLSSLDFLKMLSKFVASLKDGHTVLNVRSNLGVSKLKGDYFFPLLINFDQDLQGIIQDDYSMPAIYSDLIGSKLIKINNIPIKDIASEILQYISFERKDFGKEVLKISFSTNLYAILKFQKNFEIEYQTKINEIKKMNLKGITFDSLNDGLDKYLGQKETKMFETTYINKKKLAIIKFNQFGDENHFKNYFDKTFKEIKLKKIQNLIIDIRKNIGGNSLLADYLMSYLTDKKFTMFDKVSNKISRDLIDAEPSYKNQKIGETIVYSLENKGIEIANVGDTEKRITEQRYAGNLYVLISNLTFSTATGFATLIQKTKRGQLIGSETGGIVNTYGNLSKNLALKHSKIKFSSSQKHFTGIAGYPEGRGIIPDIEFNEDHMTKEDQMMKFVLENVIK